MCRLEFAANVNSSHHFLQLRTFDQTRSNCPVRACGPLGCFRECNFMLGSSSGNGCDDLDDENG